MRAGWDWLKGPEPWTRRMLAGDLALATVAAVLGLGVEELDRGSGARMLASAVLVVALTLLRRRLPAATLVAGSALSAVLPGALLVTGLLGWSAGRRIEGVGRALAAFSLACVAAVGLGVVSESEMRPLLVIVFTTLLFIVTTVMPGLASRYWSQRRTPLRALQERNAQLMRERAMIAGQARLLERQRIAQDMHDSLGHQLALISVHTGALEVDPKLTDRQREAVGVLRQASVAAMHELREVVGILRDGVAAPVPVEEAAQPAARGVAGIAGGRGVGARRGHARRAGHDRAAPTAGRGLRPRRVQDRAGGADERVQARAGRGDRGGAAVRGRLAGGGDRQRARGRAGRRRGGLGRAGPDGAARAGPAGGRHGARGPDRGRRVPGGRGAAVRRRAGRGGGRGGRLRAAAAAARTGRRAADGLGGGGPGADRTQPQPGRWRRDGLRDRVRGGGCCCWSRSGSRSP
ncbi:hypothetical protein GCM10020254_43360 [Streptomyces goshikiensis]